MKQEWIDPFLKNIGKEVCIPGYTSCSRVPSVALGFALQGGISDKQPVIFLNVVHNYGFTGGVMMNSEAYSSYPHEAEILLYEGIEATILGYEENFEITNKHECMKEFTGKQVMVIYLYIS